MPKIGYFFLALAYMFMAIGRISDLRSARRETGHFGISIYVAGIEGLGWLAALFYMISPDSFFIFLNSLGWPLYLLLGVVLVSLAIIEIRKHKISTRNIFSILFGFAWLNLILFNKFVRPIH